MVFAYKKTKNTPPQIATAILKVICFITFRTVNWVLKSQNSLHKSLFKQLKDWQVSKFLQIREEKQKKHHSGKEKPTLGIKCSSERLDMLASFLPQLFQFSY